MGYSTLSGGFSRQEEETAQSFPSTEIRRWMEHLSMHTWFHLTVQRHECSSSVLYVYLWGQCQVV